MHRAAAPPIPTFPHKGGRGLMSADSLLAKIELRRILAVDFLDDRLAAHHALGFGIVGQGRRAVELPAAIEQLGDAMAEGGIVGAGEDAIEIHGAKSTR